jgi:hypothetical protein
MIHISYNRTNNEREVVLDVSKILINNFFRFVGVAWGRSRNSLKLV